MRCTRVLPILLLGGLAACGGRDHLQPELAALAKQPGTEVVRRADGGKAVVEIHRGGVVITEADGHTTTAVDRSGHGAVLCAWRVYVDTIAALDVCEPGAHEELRQDLLQAVDAIAAFIVANSITPVTKTELGNYIEQRRTETRLQRAASGNACSPEFLEHSLPEMESVPHAQRLAQTADMLSVPRPPVLDPCF